MTKDINRSIQELKKDFSLVGVKIFDSCADHIKKNLSPDCYLFNDQFSVIADQLHKSEKDNNANFFGKNIKINAIVGKNGSGKSSLLEIIYRCINNLGYYLVKEIRRNAAEELLYIDDIVCDLYFYKNDILGTIYCRGKSVGLQYDHLKIYFGKKNSFFDNFDFYKSLTKEQLIYISKFLFYTIVTNYSLQAFLDTDYLIEMSNKTKREKKVWINSIFHKNDGYITPIVLNPFRGGGILDLKRELELTKSRLSALLIESKINKRNLIDEYQLADIEYKFNDKIIIDKYKETITNFTTNKLKKEFENLSMNSYSFVILNAYNINEIEFDRDEHYTACCYLVYKTLSVASKYPNFETYNANSYLQNFNKKCNPKEAEKIKMLIAEILKDTSHITLKIRQTLNYIKWLKQSENVVKKISYEQYISSLSPIKELKKFDEINEFLPPPFYDFDIKLFKENQQTSTPIYFNRLSSGEKQFYYTISTIIYHIKNILSIQQSHRIRYRSVSLILDEIELCFHPEYQRKFINNLLSTINRLKLNTFCSFNIIIATHSPFILSDIPKRNILYLENGKSLDKKQLSDTFGANISDILLDSFFLEEGFMGEFAKNKIKSMIKILDKPLIDILDKKEMIYDTISMIGEPLIQDQLTYLFKNKFNEIDDKDKEISRLNTLLKEYQEKK